MCKVMMFAGVKKKNVDKVWKFVRAIAKPMSLRNDDGLGYAAVTADGKMFGERWLKNSDAFVHGMLDELNGKLLDSLEGVVQEPYSYNKVEYNSFGQIDKENMVAITMHTRMATTPKGLNNVHPFVADGVSVIHNGVIRNYKDFEPLVSTCDSEAILRGYLDEKIRENPTAIKELTPNLEGYYACGILGVNGTPYLDVFKSNTARLHTAFIHDLETWIISTDDDDIKNVCKEFGYTVGQIYPILPNKYVRIDAVTGNRLLLEDFEEMKAKPSYPTTTNYQQTTKNYPVVGGGTETSVKDKVYPYGKRNKISADIEEYFKGGEVSINALTEREIQEQIMENERFGMNRW